MKQIYPRLITCLLLLAVLCAPILGNSQTCPDGSPQGSAPFNHAFSIASGNTNVRVRLPKMDPASGMVTCANLCGSITGVIRRYDLENEDEDNPLSSQLRYSREDRITGPGLATPFTNTVNLYPYTPVSLAATDGNFNSGPDYFTSTFDTLVQTTFCHNITDAGALSNFYGTDSVEFIYQIAAQVYPVSGGNYRSYLLTSAFGSFTMTYCTCPSTVLPVNIHSFEVEKVRDDRAKLTWSGFTDISGEYTYTAEVSRDGRSFRAIGTFAKKDEAEAAYVNDYTANLGRGVYYFRIKQVYSNGYTRFSTIRQVELGNSVGPKFSVYPNPSTGIVGIKFDNNRSGRYRLTINNALGQDIVNKDLSVSSSSYLQVATLGAGVYWVRLIDKDTNESSVSQIIIK